MSRHTLTAVLAMALVSQHAVAESEISLGSLVRVTAPTVAKDPLVGTLVDSSTTELTLFLPESGKSTVRRDAITKLEWSNGRHSRAGKGALWGAVIGAPLGALLVGMSGGEGGEGPTAGVYIAAGGALFAVVGAGLGAMIGLAFKTDGWKQAPLSHVQVSLQPMRGGARAAVALAW